jgi:hypothetical protein
MPRYALTLAVALCASHLALAAPAPPQRLATAEAVVAPPMGNPREVAARLLSAEGLATAVRSGGAMSLGCLRGEPKPPAWLAARLSAAVDERRGTVTIRLEGCPSKDAVALLTAVVEAYKGIARQGLPAARGLAECEVILQPRGAPAQVVVWGAAPRIKALGGLERVRTGDTDDRSVTAAVDRSVLRHPRVVPAAVFGRGSR